MALINYKDKTKIYDYYNVRHFLFMKIDTFKTAGKVLYVAPQAATAGCSPTPTPPPPGPN